MKPWLLHPMAVHFPVALLVTGFALRARAMAKGGGEWTWPASRWLLWLGTASAWAALGLGLLAEKTAPHVPSAWEALADHERLAWWTAAAVTAAALAEAWSWRAKRGAAAVAAAWLAALVLLGLTAREGGEVLYEHGMGVVER